MTAKTDTYDYKAFRHTDNDSLDRYKSLVSSYLNLVNEQKVFDNTLGPDAAQMLDNHDDVEYILYEDKQNLIIAGLRLVPLNEECVFNHLSTEALYESSEIWEVMDIVVEIDYASPLFDDEAEGGDEFYKTVQVLYKGLHHKLQEIASLKGIATVLVYADEDELENIEFFGEWPFKETLWIYEGMDDEPDLYMFRLDLAIRH